jgi:hypothetical protein
VLLIYIGDRQPHLKCFKNITGPGNTAVEEHMPSMHKALGLISELQKNKKQKTKNKKQKTTTK